MRTPNPSIYLSIYLRYTRNCRDIKQARIPTWICSNHVARPPRGAAARAFCKPCHGGNKGTCDPT